MRPQPESRGDDLEAAANAAIAACDGNPHAALHALIVPNSFLIEQVDTLTKQLDWAWHLVSPGYTRSTNWRRMKSADAPRYIGSGGGSNRRGSRRLALISSQRASIARQSFRRILSPAR